MEGCEEMTRYRRQARVQDHYTQVPHGLWTAPLSYGAKVLLGWLHSHDAPYLARLTNNRIRDELGASGQVSGWIKELVAAGFLGVEKRGQANQFVLLAEPWEALADRRINQPIIGHLPDDEPTDNRSEPAEYRPVTSRKTASNQPKNGHIEEQIEEQVEEQFRRTNTQARDMTQEPLELAIVEVVTEPDFETFYALYPRKVKRPDAERAWRKLKPDEKYAAMDGLDRYRHYWRLKGTAIDYMPYPATWLNARQWEDKLPDPSQPRLDKSQQVLQRAMDRALAEEARK